ncbi:MAG: hypothetical protein LRS48_04255 [Desulfurococcales archaeon]|nr:hypothetical protein [Desulfurococcales archaeon]
MEDPISRAFRKIVEEIYWEDDVEEAVRRLQAYLEAMDEDLRSLLLEKRKKICSSPESVLNLIRLDALAEASEDETVKKILILRGMTETLFLAQCTKRWSELTPALKARVLAPLYRASYGLEMTVKNPERVDALHLDQAERNLELAYTRADELGILDELYIYVDRKAKEILESLDDEN